MRLVVDMQGAQTASRFRGIGRYTMALVREMARQRGEHEILLALSGSYADTIEPMRAAFSDILPFDAIHVYEVAGPVGGRDAANDARRQVAEIMREAYLSSLQPDIIFIPSLFEEYWGEAVTSVHSLGNSIPTAVTLHDLIPLVYREVYLKDPAMSRWYFNKLDHLRRADLLLAVSNASGREAIQYLNMPEEIVVTVSNACDDHFHPITLTNTHCAHLRNCYGIQRAFVMNTGGTDQRKYLEGLLRAFAGLPAKFRKAYSLVLVGREIEEQKAHYLAAAYECGLQAEEIVFTGYVADRELALLYNACTLLVFPSWHEGFGLPVLEAMSCGRAVIAADSSSLPEVMGRRDALFAPRDHLAITTKMVEVLGDIKFRRELEQHGLVQAKRFSWKTSAERAWNALEDLHQQWRRHTALPALTKRLRLAFVSPLPPQKTGIADYASELLPELSRHYQITLIVEQAQITDNWVQANAVVRDTAWFRANSHQFDRVIYQFGNSPFHSHMLDLLAEFPGMVVLHDFYISWACWHQDERADARGGWARTLLAGHGWSAVLKHAQIRDKTGVVSVATTYPCNLMVLQQALGIIVHSSYSRRLAQQWYGDRAGHDWTIIPLLRQLVQQSDKAIARKKLGLSEGDFVVCSFGMLDNTKLNHRLLDAWLNSPLVQDHRCRLVFVGENHGGEYGKNLLHKISQSASRARIAITGWVEMETYRTWLAAADVGVQLRTLSRGETSATVLDCMNYGLATVVNANGSMAELPSNAVRMLPDEFGDSELVESLVHLSRDDNYRVSLGAIAKAYIRDRHCPRRCAEQYASAMEIAYAKASQELFGLTEAIPKFSPSLDPREMPSLARALSVNFPPRPRKRQLLLDVSALVNTNLWSGIERVTRALLSELSLVPPDGWSVEPVCATSDGPGYLYARKFMCKFLGIPDDWAEDAPVQVWQGDIFLGLDFHRDVVIVQESTLRSWHARGVGIFFVTHDLLPVTKAKFFPSGAEVAHQRWLNVVSRFDGALCVSRNVADEFYEWLQVFGERRDRPFMLHWYHHGADIGNSAPSIGMPTDAQVILRTLMSRPTFLMVGTIEPRKAYLQTLQAFEELWERGMDINLVIVGREGWKPLPDAERRDIPQTVDALRNHAELGKRLFWLEGISDEFLERVYVQANCLIVASYGEGFGLPLIEAAQHGLAIVARDIPVFREVAGDHAYFFPDSRDPQAIRQAVQDWLNLHKNNAHPRSDALPRKVWKDSAKQILDAILGDRPSYKTWRPDGVQRYWGADPRLHTEVGERCDTVMRTTGKEGVMIYGPYVNLVPGKYKVTFSGDMEHLAGGEYFDVSANEGHVILEKSKITMGSSEKWSSTCDFEVRDEHRALEYRVTVTKNTSMSVALIAVERLSDV